MALLLAFGLCLAFGSAAALGDFTFAITGGDLGTLFRGLLLLHLALLLLLGRLLATLLFKLGPLLSAAQGLGLLIGVFRAAALLARALARKFDALGHGHLRGVALRHGCRAGRGIDACLARPALCGVFGAALGLQIVLLFE